MCPSTSTYIPEPLCVRLLIYCWQILFQLRGSSIYVYVGLFVVTIITRVMALCLANYSSVPRIVCVLGCHVGAPEPYVINNA